MDMPLIILLTILSIMLLLGAAMTGILTCELDCHRTIMKTYAAIAVSLVVAMICLACKYETVAGVACRVKHGPVDVIWHKGDDKKIAKLLADNELQLKRAYYFKREKCKRCGQVMLHAVMPKLTEKQKLADKYDELVGEEAE